MHFRQFYVGCLAHASYLIGDGGEAAVVDPSRDIDMYLDEARAHGFTIRWVLETHLHADFVSGHRELAERTGATIGIGARAGASFPHRALVEGDTIRIGRILIRVVETPGHTPESLTFMIHRDEDGPPWGALTGDTLFVGDVGRVDILSSRLPVADMAGLLYDSLHGKLLELPDETRVYPAHGAGSLCGRNIGKETWSTIGKERATNAALAPRSREAFVADITQDVPETPVYFLHSRDMNQAGPPVRRADEMPPALAPVEAKRLVDLGAVLIDTRPPHEYGAGHPRGALNVPLDGSYASWVGTLVRPTDAIVLLAEPARVEEAVMRLTRVGYDGVAGLLESVEAWREAGLPVATTAQEPATTAVRPGRRVLDVRRIREWEDFHADAVNVPLSELPARIAELDRDAEWVAVCTTGYRSSIATSVLERAGFTRLVNAVGGMNALRPARTAG